MKVTEIIKNSNNLIEKPIEIEGFMIIRPDFGYISPDATSCEKFDESILIYKQFHQLKKQLLRKVPVLVGGLPYQDFVTITGTLCQSNIEHFPLALENVTSLILTRRQGTKIYQIEMPPEDFNRNI